MGQSILLTYATEAFEPARTGLAASARRVGFDRVLSYGPADMAATGYFSAHAAILREPRGAGYWLWKPYWIWRTLTEMSDDDVLVYSDVGRTSYFQFDMFPEALISRARASRQGFVVGPVLLQHGPASRWTKRDCFVLLDCDEPRYWRAPLVQATWSVWTRERQAVDFARLWLSYCEDPRCITDMPNVMGLPNLPDFVDHRHDQAILGLLAFRKGTELLDYRASPMWQLMRIVPWAFATHAFLKRISNAERIERGLAAPALFLREAARTRFLPTRWYPRVT